MTDELKLTQSMTSHLNGDSKFSELHYKVLANGQETGITRHTRTNGRPQYLKTHDQFNYGDDSFDVLATKGVGLMDWLKPRATEAIAKAQGAQAPAEGPQ